jgi:ligand-binding SRPBCC domain-containing protein
MAAIRLETTINAPIEVCFNLARSIDAHQHTTNQTNEKAVDGRTGGLIEKGETVTWQARHFGITQHLTVIVTDMEYPTFFSDEMQKGAFKTMQHQHTFISIDGNTTLMKDEFYYTVPLGVLGKLFDNWVLKNYMNRFLLKRNKILKITAESGEWKKFIPSSSS